MKRAILVVVAGLSAGFTDCIKRDLDPVPVPGIDTAPLTGGPEIEADKLSLFGALPTEFASAKNPITAEKIALGRVLYHDPRLSKNQDVSCASCHVLKKFGVDNKPTSSGHKGQLGARNSPSVFNIGGAVAQFWDGRAADLEEQAKGPILNPVEMAMPNEARVVATLKSIPGYAPLFKAAFPSDADPVSYENMARAIGAFERRLVTPSRFDKYIGGDKAAMSRAEKEGLRKFLELGCQTCHNGAAFGGSSFQKLGLVKAFETKDLGRFDHTKQDADRLMFRVPSLRNVAETAPYFHDGSVKTLDEAIVLMARHQLGKEISKDETASIVTFLKSLSGTLPDAYIAEPKLPPSGPTTPKPDPT